MNFGQVLGWILIFSGVILSVALVMNASTSNQPGLSTFFSAYAGICFTVGVILIFKAHEKVNSQIEKLAEIRVFSEKD